METLEINLRINPRSLTLDQFERLTSKAFAEGITSDEFVLNAILDKLDGPAAPVRKPKPAPPSARPARRKRRAIHV